MDEQLQCTLPKCILLRIISTQSVDDGVVLLPFVVSLKSGSITGVPMSPVYGGYQGTTPPPYYTTTTFATTGYYTESPNYYTNKAPDYYTTTYASPSHNTAAPKYYSASS
ncbi:uncharacterized protein LOC124343823 [Daphnia pulicaria]|uniref:uncharacterized protein LOC124343823 n=1 Tax=Daphnia pulicaria TaxID=35523 RepID=UPI001EEBE304|nr:uncharacterized protein LOC124343823 [Daphnia pulicaria]